MTSSEPNDPLDVLLHGENEHVADDGFTARVMAALPARRRALSQRLVILSGATVICAALVVWLLSPAGAFMGFPVENFAVPDPDFLLFTVLIAFSLGSVFCGMFALAAEE